MVGRLGDDDAAELLRRLLADEGIDVGQVRATEDCASGLAVIEVDDSGENRIVVISGANKLLTTEDLEVAAPLIAAAPVLLTQLEIPTEIVGHLAGMPRTGHLLLNPAPAVAEIDLDLFDIIAPNRGELATLVGATEAASTDEVLDQVDLLPVGPDAVVVTMGGEGALVVDHRRSGHRTVEHIPARTVSVVDTTAAGDAFCGALADALCLGAEIVEAARWATRVAAVTVTRRGAQDSLPTRAQVIS
jgi:ribokinase